MFEPVGPLPPAVYWRRRAVTIVALVAAIALILWVVSRLASADPGSGTAAAGTSGSASSSAAATGGATDPTGSAAPAESAPADAGTSGDAATSADPSTGATEAADPAATQPPASETAPPAPGVCAPESIKVSVSANANEFAYGSKPKLILSVQNISAQSCYRDLNAAGQEITVWDGAGTRLWSSNDCYPETSNDTRLLDPGQQVDYEIVWSGKVSEPTCTAPRPLLGPGQYLLQAAQDGIVSERVPFSIV